MTFCYILSYVSPKLHRSSDVRIVWWFVSAAAFHKIYESKDIIIVNSSRNRCFSCAQDLRQHRNVLPSGEVCLWIMHRNVLPSGRA